MVKQLFLAGSFAALASLATAQTIEMETLGDARAFAPGIDISGGLSADGWIGTPADRAVRLLNAMDADTRHPVVRDMLRRVILAGVAPPQGADEAFERTRIRAAQDLATPEEYARFAARNPAANDPALRADAAIAMGDLQSACLISDAVLQGRSESYWVRLRAACHDLRDETPAAELARELLRDRGEATELVVPEQPEPFWTEAMSLPPVDLQNFMEALAEEQLSDEGLAGDVPDPFADPFAPELAAYDFDSAVSDPSAQGSARLFLLGQAGDAKAIVEFVDRAETAGFDPDKVLARIPALLDPSEMAAVDLPLFARHAVATSDIGLIQALFEVTENEVLRQRLALASDALGGGFIARPLGEGLEGDLAQDGPTAKGDVLMALALGAELSETAETALSDMRLGSEISSDWIAIDQAIDRGARAEALLRLAAQVPGDEWTLYRTIRGLRDAGFSDVAGKLAAYEFLRGL